MLMSPPHIIILVHLNLSRNTILAMLQLPYIFPYTERPMKLSITIECLQLFKKITLNNKNQATGQDLNKIPFFYSAERELYRFSKKSNFVLGM